MSRDGITTDALSANESGARQSGRLAFEAGLKSTDCPFANRSPAFKEWIAGWREASDAAPNDYDVCDCGDYRHQHVKGKGACELRELCTPARCGKFRLSKRATCG